MLEEVPCGKITCGEREREKVSGKRENDRILVGKCQGRMRRGKVRVSVKERESAIKRESSCG